MNGGVQSDKSELGPEPSRVLKDERQFSCWRDILEIRDDVIKAQEDVHAIEEIISISGDKWLLEDMYKSTAREFHLCWSELTELRKQARKERCLTHTLDFYLCRAMQGYGLVSFLCAQHSDSFNGDQRLEQYDQVFDTFKGVEKFVRKKKIKTHPTTGQAILDEDLIRTIRARAREHIDQINDGKLLVDTLSSSMQTSMTLSDEDGGFGALTDIVDVVGSGKERIETRSGIVINDLDEEKKMETEMGEPSSSGNPFIDPAIQWEQFSQFGEKKLYECTKSVNQALEVLNSVTSLCERTGLQVDEKLDEFFQCEADFRQSVSTLFHLADKARNACAPDRFMKRIESISNSGLAGLANSIFFFHTRSIRAINTCSPGERIKRLDEARAIWDGLIKLTLDQSHSQDLIQIAIKKHEMVQHAINRLIKDNSDESFRWTSEGEREYVGPSRFGSQWQTTSHGSNGDMNTENARSQATISASGIQIMEVDSPEKSSSTSMDVGSGSAGTKPQRARSDISEFKASCLHVYSMNEPFQSLKAFKLILKLAQRASGNPQDPKLRLAVENSKAFEQKISRTNGGYTLLRTLGYERVPHEKGTFAFRLRDEALLDHNLKPRLRCLETIVEDMSTRREYVEHRVDWFKAAMLL